MSNMRHPEKTPPDRDTWEYLTHQIDYDKMESYAQTMNDLGAAGWELVNALPLSRGGSFRYVGGLTTALQLIYKRRRM